jgi:bacterioferritin-associated ferredoxin
MPSVDVDAMLLNLRIASYGNKMDFDTVCPSCNEENNFNIDLSGLVSTIKMPDFDSGVVTDGLTIKLKPQPYYEINKANQMSFTEQQILRTINDATLNEEEKRKKSDAYLNKLIDLNVVIASNSTESITTEDGTVVTDAGFIKEFYESADFKTMRLVQDKLGELAEVANIKPIDTTCGKCGHQYSVPMAFDYANFFVQGF